MGNSSKSGKKILVVDDNETIVVSITKVLEKEGYKTDYALDGMSAVKKALYNNYNLILLDITLPDIDGFQVCTELNKNHSTRYTPIIFISNLDDDTIYNKGFELGVMDYLKKPIPSAELLFRIRNYLRLGETENKLRQSELLFRSIVNDQAEFVVRYKPDGTITFVNMAFCIYMKKRTRDLLGSNFFDLLNIKPDSEMQTRITGSGFPVQTDTIQVTMPGDEQVWQQWIQRSIIDRLSHKMVIQSIGRDITEKKKAEDNMRRWEHIFTNAAFGILVTSSESLHFEQMNKAYASMHGYTIEELSGKKISKVFSKGSDKLISDIIEKVKKQGFYSYQSQHVRKNGEEFPASTDLSLMKDEEGKIMLLAIVQDITKSKQSEKELLKLSTAMKQSRSAIIITDIKGITEYVNPYFEELTGYTPEEVIGKDSVMFFYGQSDPKFAEKVQATVSSGNIWQGEIVNRKRNNEMFTLHAIITPVKDENNNVVNYIGIGQDITQQKEIDRQILQTIISTEEKERSRFAQDLHDDLGPLLSTAKLYIRSFETATDEKNKQIAVKMSMKAIDEAIMSIKEIANNISPHVLRNFGLISGIQSFISKINETNTIKISFRAGTQARFDVNTESSLFRIVAELVNNTLKHANATRVSIEFSLEEENLTLLYSDDGVGFNLEKALGKKLSRGITNILNRVKSLGGEVSFNDKPHKGFIARIKIPVAGHMVKM